VANVSEFHVGEEVRTIIRSGSDALCARRRTDRGMQNAPCSVEHMFDGGTFSPYKTGQCMEHAKEAIMGDPHDCVHLFQWKEV
jgi:hypothetical protein